jgi:hypothetical protein
MAAAVNDNNYDNNDGDCEKNDDSSGERDKSLHFNPNNNHPNNYLKVAMCSSCAAIAYTFELAPVHRRGAPPAAWAAAATGAWVAVRIASVRGMLPPRLSSPLVS